MTHFGYPQIQQVLRPFNILTNLPVIAIRSAQLDVVVHPIHPGSIRPGFRFEWYPTMQVHTTHNGWDQHGVIHEEGEQGDLHRFLIFHHTESDTLTHGIDRTVSFSRILLIVLNDLDAIQHKVRELMLVDVHTLL